MSVASNPSGPFDLLAPQERPDVTELVVTADEATLTLRLRLDMPWFDGHFPDRPILPGVAQVHLAGIASLAVFDPGLQAGGTGRLKFLRPITPHMPLCLHLQRTATGTRFSYTSGTGVCTRGSLLLGR